MKQILGTMTFGDQVDQAAAESLITSFRGAGHLELDTAHTYCEGRTEQMLGRILTLEDRGSVYIASKVNPWNDDGLQAAEVHRQFAEILDRLRRDVSICSTCILPISTRRLSRHCKPVSNCSNRANSAISGSVISRPGRLPKWSNCAAFMAGWNPRYTRECTMR